MSYFKITAQYLNSDGWIAIAAFAILFVIAMCIIANKVITLFKVKAANREFLQDLDTLGGVTAKFSQVDSSSKVNAWNELILEPALKHDEDRFSKSTIYHSYLSGLAEVKRCTRVTAAKSTGAADTCFLAPQTIDAIRSIMNTTANHMNNDLAAKMALLTVTIFSASLLAWLSTSISMLMPLAVSDSHISLHSIAPRIAGIMAGTIAGIIVVVPTLLGYNWLNTQIKSICTDTQLFIDKFIAQIIELNHASPRFQQ